ncbi:hypothetical protein ZOSMA_7G00700 [Zostera marina]|uniref:Uncharacterized protein n=1 Tax=Zostera marina TaxID=29655 RepID=A0A0K9NMR1_ZOSMR|nr:hypothetical protein ZOSMA_7G00700 [Zostera marina]
MDFKIISSSFHDKGIKIEKGGGETFKPRLLRADRHTKEGPEDGS